MIDLDYLKQLLELFDGSTANDLRLEEEGVSIKLSKSAKKDEAAQATVTHYAAPAAPTAIPAQPAETAADETEEISANHHEIRSPIVGTFYSSPNPDSPSFVEAGQEVSPGSVLCIVEAMKLMNEIECDVYGKVAKVLVENAQPVEYNQLLFLIEQD